MKKLSSKALERLALQPRAPGFPKRLPCLVCSRLRRASWPGDRIHAACRRRHAGMMHLDAEYAVSTPHRSSRRHREE